MGVAERRVADFVLAHPEEVLRSSITQVAEVSDTSEGTVVRFCRSVGYRGYQQLKISLARELVPPLKLIHEDVREGDDAFTVAQKVLHADVQAILDTLKILDRVELERAVESIRLASKVEFYGVGSSAPVAVDAYYRLLQIGVDASVCTDSHFQVVSAARLDKGCVAVGISHTGSTRETLAALSAARRSGATTICITSFPKSPVTLVSDIRLVTAARETVFRPEAMASRIAHLCVVDVLYVNIALRRLSRSLEYMGRASEALSEKRL